MRMITGAPKAFAFISCLEAPCKLAVPAQSATLWLAAHTRRYVLHSGLWFYHAALCRDYDRGVFIGVTKMKPPYRGGFLSVMQCSAMGLAEDVTVCSERLEAHKGKGWRVIHHPVVQGGELTWQNPSHCKYSSSFCCTKRERMTMLVVGLSCNCINETEPFLQPCFLCLH